MNQNVLKKLEEILETNELLLNEPMKKHTTFKVGGTADIFVRYVKVLGNRLRSLEMVVTY